MHKGIEWVSIKIHGQSFMLHQIRKMVGMTVMLMRAGEPMDKIIAAFANVKWYIPKAPGLGLLLERVHSS
jgi:tRNA pseudouridine38-40 synthase